MQAISAQHVFLQPLLRYTCYWWEHNDFRNRLMPWQYMHSAAGALKALPEHDANAALPCSTLFDM